MERLKKIVIDNIEYSIGILIYTIVSCIFLIILNLLNNKLLSTFDKNDIRLLAYNNYQPLKYFIFALLLVLIGIIVITKLVKSIKYSIEITDNILYYFILIIIIFIIIILIIVFLNNPILRVIFIALSLFFLVSYRK